MRIRGAHLLRGKSWIVGFLHVVVGGLVATIHKIKQVKAGSKPNRSRSVARNAIRTPCVGSIFKGKPKGHHFKGSRKLQMRPPG